jgi:hypothetical protein
MGQSCQPQDGPRGSLRWCRLELSQGTKGQGRKPDTLQDPEAGLIRSEDVLSTGSYLVLIGHLWFLLTISVALLVFSRLDFLG